MSLREVMMASASNPPSGWFAAKIIPSGGTGTFSLPENIQGDIKFGHHRTAKFVRV